MFMFVIGSHVVTCLFLIQAKVVSSNYIGTWVEEFLESDFNGKTNFHKYIISMDFIFETITTVGYGSVSLVNNYERNQASFVMVAGVILFSVANATIMSIADDLDESGDYNDKVDTLIKLSKETDMKLQYKLRIQ